VPEQNPFGVFIRTPDVDAIVARVDDLIIRPGEVLRHREWASRRLEYADRTTVGARRLPIRSDNAPR
jgi:hypothetical protein